MRENEWLCAGPKVSLGYVGRPDLTAKAFINPLQGAGRLYATGDRVQWLSNGALEFLGRADFQVKLNGQRVELGEVEAVVRGASGVQDVLVVPAKPPGGSESLVAYVVPSEVEISALRSRCQNHLPNYMVPSAVMALAGPPHTPY